MQLKAYLLDRFAERNSLYSTWMDECSVPCEVVKDVPSHWEPPEDCGIVITHEHYRWDIISTLGRILRETSIPVLILSDGVLEFRNTWENPGIAEGSLFQPLFGHKLACLGRAPARQIEAWGNAGKCEIVGHPKFDQLYDLPHTPTQDDGEFRLLVTTARTPAFTPEQHAAVVAGLEQIKQRLRRNPRVNGRPVQVTWRLSQDLATQVHVQANWKRSLRDAIDMSDAVITTPSTVYLESVIMRRPTAILDFTNSPAYVPSAWTITAPMHVTPVLQELAQPPASKMLFQRNVLHDQLELGGNAASRLNALIQEMVHAGQQARASGKPIELPARILSDPQRGIAKVEDEFDARSLYPDSVPFHLTEEQRLRQELAQAIARLGQLPAELHYKENIIEDMHRRKLVLLDALEQSQVDLDKKSEHIDYLQSLFDESNQKLRQVNESSQTMAEEIERQRGVIRRQREAIEHQQAQLDALSAESSVKLQQIRQAIGHLQPLLQASEEPRRAA